ncbi:MAG: Ig-like domain-containing protein [Myxococcota bacterium]|nr:Ig-like domain-containing protein [Myxococcota bacterium]
MAWLLILGGAGCSQDEETGPVVEITSHGDGDVLIKKQSTQFHGVIRDLTGPSENLEAFWFIGEKRVCGRKSVDVEGATSCKAKPSGQGDSSLTLEVRVPAAAGIPERSFSTSIPVVVLPAWQVPECSITSHQDGGAHSQSDPLRLEGVVEYASGFVDAGEVSWSSDVDGELGTSDIGSLGVAALDVTALSLGSHTIEMKYEPENEVGCEAAVGILVATGPEVSWIEPSSGSLVDQGVPVELRASVSVEGGVSGLAFEVVSDSQGQLVDGTLDDSGELGLSLDSLQAGSHELTLTVWSDTDVPGQDLVEVTVDGWPSAPTVQVQPNPALEGDSLQLSILRDSEDPEGSSVQYSYAWLLNGQPVPEHDGATAIDGALVFAGDTWTARVQGSDGRLSGPWGEESLGVSGYAGWSNQTMTVSDAEVLIRGAQAGDAAGGALAAGCDMDGDGRDDLLVGAPGGDIRGSDAGQVYWLSGLAVEAGVSMDLGVVGLTIKGETAGDEFGHALSCLGDVDGDGLDDLIASAPGNDYGGIYAGRSYVFLGADLPAGNVELSSSSANWRLHGEATSDQSGASLGAGGDIDGDGLDDLLIGSWAHSEAGLFSGRSYVVLASELGTNTNMGLDNASSVIDGMGERSRAGFNLAGIGDVDADGLSDVILGAYSEARNGDYSGTSYIVTGEDLGASAEIELGESDQKLTGENGGDYSGSRVQGVGDVDGDGADDLAIGAIGSSRNGSHSGAVYVVYASTLASWGDDSLAGADLILVGESAGDEAGRSISTAGDVDGDGRDDLLVGAPYNNEVDAASGKVYLLLASSLPSGQVITISEADHSFTGSSVTENTGDMVDHSGDLDGDGLPDIVVGGSGFGDNFQDRGQVGIFLGPNLRDSP